MRMLTPALVGCLALLAFAGGVLARPNVVLIITDDQGWGDLGVHGNTKIKTPHIDAFAREGVQFTRFYAGPVCTPTRASLMTGRYHLRTRAIDTYLGRAIIDPAEVTLAESLAGAGYRTGIFGKWHLGDHYPSRAMDQGFQEAFVHHGGGIAQPSDPPQGSGYADPWLEHNGKLVKTTGYCSDVYTDAAIRFIGERAEAKEPFFTYLAFNAPHTPMQVPDEWAKPYIDAGIELKTAQLYAMVTNIDENVGRVLKAIEEKKLIDDTIVIFMTDNGPQNADRYNGVLRAAKGTVYEGGIRVPFFIRWPAGFTGAREIDRIASTFDLMPTLLRACDVAPPAGVKLDGVSLLPLLKGEAGAWPDRTLYFQWHRGDVAERGRNAAAVTQQYKLAQPVGGPATQPTTGREKWELYDLQADPSESKDLATAQPELAAGMRKGYDAWFADVTSTRSHTPVPIHLGGEHENPVLLTRQDRRLTNKLPDPKDPGFWVTHVAKPGTYAVTLIFDAAKADAKANLQIGNVERTADVRAGDTEVKIDDVRLGPGDAKLVAWTEADATKAGVSYVHVERKE